MAVLGFLCAIGYFLWPFFVQLQQGPTLYNRILVVMGVIVSALELCWPKLGTRLRTLSPAVPLLMITFCILMLIMDIKTGGFGGFTLFGIAYGTGLVLEFGYPLVGSLRRR